MHFQKYFNSFKLALSAELVNRLHFLLGVVRNIVFFITLVFVYQNTTLGMVDYTSEALINYAIVSYTVSSVLFVWYMTEMAGDIEKGNLSLYLVKPVNYIGYVVSRVTATRVLLVFATVCGAALVSRATNISFDFLREVSLERAVIFAALVLGSLILIHLIDLIGGIITFWTIDHGVQWLVTILITFLSGAYVPTDALPPFVARALFVTPFPSMVFAPVSVLVRAENINAIRLITIQWIWIFILFIFARILWKRGLRQFEGNGR